MPIVRSGKIVKCHCGVEFYATPKRLKAKTLSCSKKCAGELAGLRLSKRVEVTCVMCGNKMLRKESQRYRVIYPACSHECKSKARSLYRIGEENTNFKNRSNIEKIFHERAAECNRRGILLNKEHDLTGDTLYSIFLKQKGLCFYTGHPMGFGKKTANSMSVDRIDPNHGYTITNVVLCCLSINMMKSNYKIYDVIQIMESYMKNEENRIPLKIVNNTEFEISKNSYGNVGLDLYVNSVEDCGNFIKVKTGVHIQPPPGFYFDLVVRSSTHKKGLALYNSVGIIDQSYTGEIIALLYKTKDFKELPNRGDRLVQIIPRRSLLVDPIVVDKLEDTVRGDGGFGSTGR